MSGQEGRRQLGASRRKIQDDSFCADAIDQAENDLTMAEWWKEQRALDKILSRNCVNSPCRRPCALTCFARNIRPLLRKRTTVTRAAGQLRISKNSSTQAHEVHGSPAATPIVMHSVFHVDTRIETSICALSVELPTGNSLQQPR
jgi:hypothetical protein